MKNGTDKKGPQIDRNDCEGPRGRTTLIVILYFIHRVLTSQNKSDLKEILLKQSKIGNRPKRRELNKKRERLNKLKDSSKKERKKKVRKYDFYA